MRIWKFFAKFPKAEIRAAYALRGVMPPASSTTNMTDGIKPYRVLALDGGGIRGLYTATVLDALAAFFAARRKDADVDVGRLFHLITGTSTGGILACGLAAGVPISKIAQLYEVHGPKIFANPLSSRLWRKLRWMRRSWFAAANKAEPLRQALTEIFGEKTLGEVFNDRSIALCVPSTRMLNHHPKVFKTPHNSRFQIDLHYRVVDVCMATSAAPIFLPLACLNDPTRPGTIDTFADGGLWCNDPIMVGLTEALEICEMAEKVDESRNPTDPRRPIEILSIGTIGLAEGDPPTAKANRGLAGWQIGVKTTALVMNAQAASSKYMAAHLARRITALGRTVRVVRIEDPYVSVDQSKHLGLDVATPEAIGLLKQIGSNKAQAVMSQCTNPCGDDGEVIRGIFNDQP